jgi:hypothetical protein
MRKQKFLFWLVIIILVFNIGILILTKTRVFNGILNKYAVSILSEKLDSKITIGDLTLSDKQIIVNEIRIDSNVGDYMLNMDQLIVDYKLIGLLPVFNKRFKPLNEITAVNPEVIMKYRIPEKKGEESAEFKIPNIGRYFKSLSIIGGNVKYTLEKYSKNVLDLYLTDEISDIEAHVEAFGTRELIADVTAKRLEGGTLKATCRIYDGYVIDASAEIKHFLPAEFTTGYLDELAFVVDMKGSYQTRGDSIYYYLEANLADTFIEKDKHKIFIPKAELILENNILDFAINKLSVDEVIAKTQIRLLNPFSERPKISGKVNIHAFNPAIFTDQIVGLIDGDFEISGDLKSPEVHGSIGAERIRWKDYNLNQVSAEIVYEEGIVGFNLNHAKLMGNSITGDGSIKDFKTIELSLRLEPETADQKVMVTGDLVARMSLDKSRSGFINLNDVNFKNDLLDLMDFDGELTLKGDSLTFNLAQSEDLLKAEGSFNLSTMYGTASLNYRNIILNRYIRESIPAVINNIEIYGTSEVLLENSKFFVDSSLRLVDVRDIAFDTRVKLDLQYDLKDKRGELNAFTKSSLMNNRTFYAEIEASAYGDSIVIRNLGVNDYLNASGWVNLSPQLTYGFKINGEKLDIREILKYKMTNYQTNQFNGTLDIALDFNSDADGIVEGLIRAEDFSYGNIQPISTEVSVSGTKDRVEIINSFLNPTLANTLELDGYLLLKDKFELKMGGAFTDLELSDIIKEGIEGKVSGRFGGELSNGETGNPILEATVASAGLKVGTFDLSRVFVDVKQYSDSLVIDELNLFSRDQINLDVQGALGYNLLTGETILNDKYLSLKMTSDLAKVLKNLKLADSGKLSSELSAELFMEEDGISIKEGRFIVKDGKLHVKTQNQELSAFNIDISIRDNLLNMDSFSLKVGNGKLYLRNEIENNDKDLMIGMLRIGRIYVKTGADGILVTVPEYSQENTLTNAVIKGRHAPEAFIQGPFDDLYIEADVILRNAMALYPPKVDNLLKLFSQLNPLVKKKPIGPPPAILPFRLDVIIYCDENSRYITYPANIPVNENSFIHLNYNGEEWLVNQLLISADSGTFDFFGINFRVDYFEVGINPYSGEYLLGELYHKTSDGTTIFLTIDTSDDTSKSFEDRLNFRITSDNPSDSNTMSILARLRYESDLADLSAEQQSAIWQDEALNLLEGNLNSYYLDPILFPIENKIKRFFKLDFLFVNFGFLQNVYSNYVINESDAVKREESQIVEFSSSILLDNMKINAGKYLTRNIYLDYTALFQETTDLERKTKIIVDHDATFRVSLPYQFKISYSFGIKPDEMEQYSHEIMLQRSFRFDFNNYRYHKKHRRHYAIQPLD